MGEQGTVARFEVLVAGHVYNIGTDFEISNLDTTKTLLRMFGLTRPDDEVDGLLLAERERTLAWQKKFIVHVEDRQFNDRRYKIDGGKLSKSTQLRGQL